MHVTQRVDPEKLRALLERPPRAAIAFVERERIEVLPVTYRHREGRHLVGVPRRDLPAASAPERAFLLVDDGCAWFELRAVSLRGRLLAALAPPAEAPSDLLWLELVPDHVVAWDYATLHEEAEA